MIKSKFIIIFILFNFYCVAQKSILKKKNIIKPVSCLKYKPTSDNFGINYKNSDNWYNEKYTNNASSFYDFKKSKSIVIVKKQYMLKNGYIYYKKIKIKNLVVFYRQNDNISYVLYIVNGKPIGYDIYAYNNPLPTMYHVSYKDDNLNYKYIENEIFIFKGSGIFKSYYYGKWYGNNQRFTQEIVKEEGEVKENFKFGEWKYYDKEGKTDSLKIYSSRDSIDIRFPYCLFNKKEPSR